MSTKRPKKGPRSMATTESRTGFRLPWSPDRAPSRDGFEEASGDDPSAPSVGPDESELDAVDAASTPDSGTPDTTEAAVDMSTVDASAAWAPEPSGAVPDSPVLASTPSDPPAAHDSAPARRPTKFLTDLTHAMQVAAEQARAATLEQFRVDGSTYVEQIQGRSVADAGSLRRHADDDVARIKDWSKAEIARIREETETRIAGRRGQLDDQLARHRALVDRDVARIEGQIASFEAKMAAFFDELLAETDLTLLAAHAQQMPEAPTFEELDDTAFTALMTEPAVGIPAPAAAAEPEPPVAIAPAIEPEPVSVPPMSPAGDDEGTLTAESPLDDPAFDREAAMAAIQAAAEAAASLEAETTASAEAAPEDAEPGAATTAGTDGAADLVPPSVDASAEQDVDPRLAMLGLTPDFAAAELAAAEAAAAEVQEIPEMDEQDLTARLAGLVGSSSAPAPAEVRQGVPFRSTQVIVSGLVSVASIASFKRHLSRAAGVRHVGVSSGPDGEFLFTVQHEDQVALRDLIPTLPGFQARVTGGSDGIVTASAHDPED